MNRKYYFNNTWWGWVTGGYMLYMSWDYDFKYRLLFWCISLCGMVLYPVAKWYIEDTALKFTRPDFWNSGFFTDTPGKMGLLAVYTGTVFILSLPLSMIYILSVIIKRLSVR
ncbi:TPA: colicin transporter [Escherichia coli]|uniref:colicin E1 family microcin immunity protein n=1 Tax=Escherichia coli TaxID=562 RepID=UPI0022B7668D|nr:colicin E1 family microcin immunity protein [Escherichia coli]EKA4220619.1 colicin transporter [Escherichia coli]EKA4229982.1 colicin transporter [Escherichia coli]MCN2067621.1 colicin E1 immunity protein [Escherichia coli]MCZ2875117.1 colicin E1 family microcin immunity protein [Escherichia coli]HDK0636342.1 colicin transporter [Escherichia coli]